MADSKQDNAVISTSSNDDTLGELGWRAFFSKQVSVEEEQRCHPVRVMTVHRGKIAVKGNGPLLSITPYVAGALPSDDHPTVGDWLLVDDNTLQPTRGSERDSNVQYVFLTEHHKRIMSPRIANSGY